MRIQLVTVLDRLRSEGLAPDGVHTTVRAALAESADDMPWYMRAAVGFGAWVATGLLLAFLLTVGGLQDETSRVVVGAMLIGGAVLVRRKTVSEFMRHAAVAASLAGQGLLLVGIGEMFDSGRLIAGVAIALSTALIWLMPDRVHRFLSTVAGSIFALFLMHDVGGRAGFEVMALVLVALTAFVWRSGPLRCADDPIAELLEPVGYGLVIALFGTLLFSAFTAFAPLGPELGISVARAHLGPATTIGIAIALIALVIAVIDEHGTPRTSGVAYAAISAVVALALGSLSSPGIVAGAAILALGFDRRNVVLITLAALFLIVFASVYYYSLTLTLLEKSGVLVGSGLLFLAVRTRLTSGDEGEPAAP